MTEFKYGLPLRPAGVGSAPTGFTKYDEMGSYDDSGERDRSTRHGVVIYPNELSDEEIKRFELVPIHNEAYLQRWIEKAWAKLGKYAHKYLEMGGEESLSEQMRSMAERFGPIHPKEYERAEKEIIARAKGEKIEEVKGKTSDLDIFLQTLDSDSKNSEFFNEPSIIKNKKLYRVSSYSPEQWIGWGPEDLALTVHGEGTRSGELSFAYDSLEQAKNKSHYGDTIWEFTVPRAIKVYHKGDDEFQVVFSIKGISEVKQIQKDKEDKHEELAKKLALKTGVTGKYMSEKEFKRLANAHLTAYPSSSTFSFPRLFKAFKEQFSDIKESVTESIQIIDNRNISKDIKIPSEHDPESDALGDTGGDLLSGFITKHVADYVRENLDVSMIWFPKGDSAIDPIEQVLVLDEGTAKPKKKMEESFFKKFTNLYYEDSWVPDVLEEDSYLIKRLPSENSDDYTVEKVRHYYAIKHQGNLVGTLSSGYKMANAAKEFIDGWKRKIQSKEQEKLRKNLVKEKKARLQKEYDDNKNIIDNAHKNTELDFKAMPLEIYNKADPALGDAILVYKSPVYNNRQSSEYKVMFIDDELVYARKSNHWGKFHTNIKVGDEDADPSWLPDQFGRVGYKEHFWHLDGGDDSKKTSQAGYIPVKNLKPDLKESFFQDFIHQHYDKKWGEEPEDFGFIEENNELNDLMFSYKTTDKKYEGDLCTATSTNSLTSQSRCREERCSNQSSETKSESLNSSGKTILSESLQGYKIELLNPWTTENLVKKMCKEQKVPARDERLLLNFLANPSVEGVTQLRRDPFKYRFKPKNSKFRMPFIALLDRQTKTILMDDENLFVFNRDDMNYEQVNDKLDDMKSKFLSDFVEQFYDEDWGTSLEDFGFINEDVDRILTLWHGGKSGIDRLSADLTKSKIFGNAIYFTNSYQSAKKYATERYGADGVVYKAKVRLNTVAQNPVQFKNDESYDSLVFKLASGETNYAVKNDEQVLSLEKEERSDK